MVVGAGSQIVAIWQSPQGKSDHICQVLHVFRVWQAFSM
jgi:hypothetical protein